MKSHRKGKLILLFFCVDGRSLVRCGRSGLQADAAPKGSYSTLQHSLYGNIQLAASASIETHPTQLDFTCYKGKDKGQNIFQLTVVNVNDKVIILKLETSAPAAGFGSPFSWRKMGNTLRVKDISQLLPNYYPLTYGCTKFGLQVYLCK